MTRNIKDRSMELQKEMIAAHYRRLEAAPETGEPVVYTFVPGNLTELIRSFDALPLLPEINALQSGMRGRSGDYISTAEKSGPTTSTLPSTTSSLAAGNGVIDLASMASARTCSVTSPVRVVATC